MIARDLSLLLSLLVTLAHGQLCANIDQLLSNYVECVFDNVCNCTGCDDVEIPDITTIGDLTCENINAALCPAARCCGDCSQFYEEFVQCTTVEALAPFIGDCTLDCSGFPLTGTPSTEPECVDGCSNQLGDYLACTVTECSDDADTCNAIIDDFSFGDGDSFCSVLEGAYCQTTECCPACDSTRTIYFQCLATTVDEQCALGDCQNGGTPTISIFPTQSPTDAKRETPSPTTSSPTTSSPTTSSPITSSPTNGSTDAQSQMPSMEPNTSPLPTASPTDSTSASPTGSPTDIPTDIPSGSPAETPTDHPTDSPTTPSPTPDSPPTDIPPTSSPTPGSAAVRVKMTGVVVFAVIFMAL